LVESIRVWTQTGCIFSRVFTPFYFCNLCSPIFFLLKTQSVWPCSSQDGSPQPIPFSTFFAAMPFFLTLDKSPRNGIFFTNHCDPPSQRHLFRPPLPFPGSSSPPNLPRNYPHSTYSLVSPIGAPPSSGATQLSIFFGVRLVVVSLKGLFMSMRQIKYCLPSLLFG